MKCKKVLALATAVSMMLTIPAVASLVVPVSVRAEVTGEAAPTDTPVTQGNLDLTESPSPTDTPTDAPDPAPSPSASAAPATPVTQPRMETSPIERKVPDIAIAPRDPGAEQFVQEVTIPGVPLDIVLKATEKDKTIGEYMNNAVVSLPGLDNVTPVAQGGNVILDGVETNATFSVDKPMSNFVKIAESMAASEGRVVLNVVDVKFAMPFKNATVNFYTPGVESGQDIQALLYTDGEWADQEVEEIREDHVVVNMTDTGVLAFVEAK